MSTRWVPQLKHIEKREPVSAGVTGRPDRSLESRTDYLKARLDVAELGEALFAYDVVLEAETLVGHAVFYSSTNNRFERALAGVTPDEETGSLFASESSEVFGVVWGKDSSTRGTLLLLGYSSLDISLATGEDPSPAGRYYLSSSSPGELTRQRPPVSVPVLFATGDGKVLVYPQAKNFQEDHVHYSFELRAFPAGHLTPPTPGDRHVIQNPDSSKRGWLPADHERFQGNAPHGAVFGYNLGAHPELERVFPPVPLEAVSVLWDKGESLLGATEVPLGSDGLVIVDDHGIWWMSDCYGDVPWVKDLDTSNPLLSLSSSSSLPECARKERMRVILSFARMSFKTNTSVVTALEKYSDSEPFQILDCDNNEASTGKLKLRFVSQFAVEDEDTDGNIAIKSFNDNKFQAGYMVQGLRSLDSRLSLSGTRKKDIGGNEYWQGLLDLTFTSDHVPLLLPAQIVRLDDVKERYYEEVLYLGFPADRASSIRVKLQVPLSGLPATPRVKIRLHVLGRTAGNLPELTLTYRKLPQAGSSEVSLPTSDSALTIDTSHAITADEYVAKDSDVITVAAGDILLFTLSREDDDGYSGEVGILDFAGILQDGD